MPQILQNFVIPWIIPVQLVKASGLEEHHFRIPCTISWPDLRNRHLPPKTIPLVVRVTSTHQNSREASLSDSLRMTSSALVHTPNLPASPGWPVNRLRHSGSQ